MTLLNSGIHRGFEYDERSRFEMGSRERGGGDDGFQVGIVHFIDRGGNANENDIRFAETFRLIGRFERKFFRRESRRRLQSDIPVC